MFVISDLADIFLPVESGLLVNLTECREQVEMLLESLPHMHKETTDVECVLGPAIDAATKVIYKVGGKMQVSECVYACHRQVNVLYVNHPTTLYPILCMRSQVFSSSLPSLGTGRLKNREDARLLGGSNEHKLLEPALPFYTRCTNQLIKYQVGLSTFVCAARCVCVVHCVANSCALSLPLAHTLR
jgi:protein transport protein SEC24